MTCDDVVPTWNAILDAGTAAPGLAALLDAHAEACPRCRAASARYRRLLGAIAAPPSPESAPPAARDRFLIAAAAATTARPTPVRPRRWMATAARPMGRFLAVAASLGAIWVGVRWSAPSPLPPPTSRPTVPIHLASAWSDATSATWDLARGVSGPAARLGRDVLDLEGLTGSPTGDDALPIGLIRSVGGQIDHGARPLPGPARRAFDFLLPDASDPDDEESPSTPDPDPTTANGAR